MRTLWNAPFMALALSSLLSGSVQAQGTPVTPSPTAGEVRRIDLTQQKITLRHDAIEHLNMPPMTMVFRVSDPSVLKPLKPGDAVRFVAEKKGSEYWVTDLQAAP